MKVNRALKAEAARMVGGMPPYPHPYSKVYLKGLGNAISHVIHGIVS